MKPGEHILTLTFPETQPDKFHTSVIEMAMVCIPSLVPDLALAAKLIF